MMRSRRRLLSASSTCFPLRQAASGDLSKVISLDLSQSKELECVNVMCENVGERCACRLAMWLTQHPLPNLEFLNLSRNQLRFVPEPVFALKKLKRLDLSNNLLSDIETDRIQASLEELDLSFNENLKPETITRLYEIPTIRQITNDSDPMPLLNKKKTSRRRP